MGKSTELLSKAVEEIIGIFYKRAAAKLTTSRSGVLIPPDAQINGLHDFRLITWLIIK